LFRADNCFFARRSNSEFALFPSPLRGLVSFSEQLPTACAVGCILSPLRGCSVRTSCRSSSSGQQIYPARPDMAGPPDSRGSLPRMYGGIVISVSGGAGFPCSFRISRGGCAGAPIRVRFGRRFGLLAIRIFRKITKAAFRPPQVLTFYFYYLKWRGVNVTRFRRKYSECGHGVRGN
jgi:hypothetical protein